jgi:outer membrane biosynthesis protein TonB
MQKMQINEDTPVEDILAEKNSKPKMVKLAQIVFDRQGLEYFRAFAQFRNVSDLGALIEAKRKNVFDYSVCVRQTDSGVRFTKNTDIVMGALKLAMDGKYEDIDLRAIGLVDANGNPVVQLQELCPGAEAPKKARKPRKKAAPEPEPVAEAPEPEDVEPAPEPEVVEPPKPAPRAKSRKAKVVVPEEEAHQSAVLISSDEILTRLDKLSGDLADALQTVVTENKKAAFAKNDIIEDEIGHVKNEVENLKAGLVGLASFLNVVNGNIQRVFEYLDPVDELPGPPESVLTLLGMAVPEDIEDRMEAAESASTPVEAPPEPEPVEEAPEPEPVEAPPEEPDEAEEYTRESLTALGLDKLREIATKYGVAKATSIPYKTALINRICQAADID